MKLVCGERKCKNSQLYSLVEFKNEKGESVRKDANLRNSILKVSMRRSIPRRIIDWGKVNA